MPVSLHNPNRGPIKLDHDLTPRDLTTYNKSADDLPHLHTCFGFKGFPINNFEKARGRITVDDTVSRKHYDVLNHQKTFTPRDFGAYTSHTLHTSTEDAPNTLNSFGFKGFPNNNFEKARKRFSFDDTPPEKYYGIHNHLDTRKPLTVGEAKGFQYGSDDNDKVHLNSSTHTGYLANKSSAELLKFRKEQEEAEFNIQKFKQEQQQRLTEREVEKKRDLEMLKSYNPWGHPGGGAPLQSSRDSQNKKSESNDHTSQGLSQKKVDLADGYGNFNNSFGRPGHGAPLRTNSGKVKTELKGDTDIRFQKSDQGKVIYHNELRYQGEGAKKLKYQQELDSQLKASKEKAQEERLENLKRELETLRHDPYNKPGGGAPHKTRSGLHIITGRRTTFTNDIEEKRKVYAKYLKEMETKSLDRASSDFEMYDPWGKGVGQPKRDQFGNTQRYKYSDPVRKEVVTESSPRKPNEVSTTLELNSPRGGAGAPRKTESGQLVTRKVITMRRNEIGDTTIREDLPGYRHKRAHHVDEDPEFAIYDPFGKSGAGAPIRDEKGNITTQIYGKLRNTGLESNSPGRKEAAQQYLNELQQEMVIHQRNKEEFDHHMKSETDGIADKMVQGRVGKPRRDPRTGLLINQHLGTTDVTKEKISERSMKTDGSKEYHTELERAAMERKRIQALDSLKETQEGNQHQKHMNSFWGRPGGGAPNNSTRLANFEDILYSPRKEVNDYYNKTLPTNRHHPHNYVRNTVNSMHENYYEYQAPEKRLPKKEYHLMMPYAVTADDAY